MRLGICLVEGLISLRKHCRIGWLQRPQEFRPFNWPTAEAISSVVYLNLRL